jgi:uncharacterized protein YwqG
MSWLKKIFGSDDSSNLQDAQKGLKKQQFLESTYVVNIVAKYSRQATVLNPHRSANTLSALLSKFGGKPNLAGFTEYPCCTTCNTPLNFVIQLYQKDFPELYFPSNRNLFQVFRCPNFNCADACSDTFESDLKLLIRYVEHEGTTLVELDKPSTMQNDLENEVPDCQLTPIKSPDFPIYDDYGAEVNDMEKNFGEDLTEVFFDTYTSTSRTKIGGYPSFTQSPHYPICDCGDTKEFFFQLASDDREEGIENPAPNNWSPHGLMFGDVGNIYFYVCRSCGDKSIETYWDCY